MPGYRSNSTRSARSWTAGASCSSTTPSCGGRTHGGQQSADPLPLLLWDRYQQPRTVDRRHAVGRGDPRADRRRLAGLSESGGFGGSAPSPHGGAVHGLPGRPVSDARAHRGGGGPRRAGAPGGNEPERDPGGGGVAGPLTYRDAGVDVGGKARLLGTLGAAVTQTYGPA